MNFYKTQQHRNAPACIEVIAISDRPENLQGWVCRSDWSTFEAAHEVAEAASIFEGVEYIAIDRGAYTSPRFDVIRAPQTLDPVSYSFNGDTYPCGYIKTISKTLKKITTTTGQTFYRHKQSGSWLMNGQWYMVSGHIQERNPHF
jgi:hypothetical protein